MKNTTEYEEIILGLQKSIDLKVFVQKVVGDSEIVVHTVRNTIHYVSLHLKSYKKEVRRLIFNFQCFNIILVPRMHNAATDALANATVRISPLRDRFSIKILYKPSILDNITNLHIFDDDQ